MPVVSIITPLFNTSKFLEDTYKSVKNQTLKDFEWIIIDDKSSDDSYLLANKLAEQDPRIKVLQVKENGGTAKARNLGLKNATGRYITFLDADDLLDSNYLEEQIKFIEKNGPIVSSGYRRMAEHTTTDFFVPEVVDYKTILKGNPLSCLTTMYDRQVIGDRFFPENMEKVEDYVFWLDILKEGYVAKGNPKALATYRISHGSKSHNKFKLIKYQYYVYHKTQGINWFKSWLYVIRWALYGLKKYKDVR